MDELELRRVARSSGLSRNVLPSLEQVERRRFELWIMSTVLLLGTMSALVFVSMWSPDQLHDLLTRPVVRFGMLGLTAALCAYTVEKEHNLRRVSRLLVDERLLTTALSNRLHEISALLDAGRAVNSTLELDQVLSSILSGATDLLPAGCGSVMLLDGQELVVVAAVGNEGALGCRVAVGDGIAGHVAKTREALLVQGRASAARFPGFVQRESSDQSAICVPLLERGVLVGVLNLRAGDGSEFSEYDLRAVSLFAEQAATAIGKARLYERSKLQAEQLAHAASHDPLTGLANRAALDARMFHAAGREALLFLDLDGFKAVNDRLGHAAGDAVLRAVASRLRACLSESDLVARFGGDEFAVVLAGSADAMQAGRIAERVLSRLAEPVAVPGAAVSVTASIGIALPDETADGNTLLQRADRAVYAAKRSGKSCWRLYLHDAVGRRGTPELPAPRGETWAPTGQVSA